MICINGGSGTPEEAARWIEYCNGPVSSPMGRLRAAHGHPEPYRVRHWEVGNELWGRWQYNWTTAAGYVDRYHQFARAMLRADPGVKLYACGAPVMWGKSWNDTLIDPHPVAGLGFALFIMGVKLFKLGHHFFKARVGKAALHADDNGFSHLIGDDLAHALLAVS